MTKQWIGMVGQNGSGKSTVCSYLEQKGFSIVSLSDVVRQEAKLQGVPEDRPSLTALASQLKETHGLDYFAKVLVNQVQTNKQVVFDSIRHPVEIQYLQSFDIYCMAITAPIDLRYERILARGKGTDHVSFEAFKAQDEFEQSGASSGQHINECLKQCEVTIENNGKEDELYAKVDQALRGVSCR